MRALYKVMATVFAVLFLSLGTVSGAELPTTPMVVNGIPVPSQRPATVFPSSKHKLFEGHTTSRPIGHHEFCERQPQECTVTPFAPPLQYSPRLVNAIQLIGTYVNRTIRSQHDALNPENPNGREINEWWKYPQRFGDCEDYVLLKRKLLHETLGIPLSNLLITVVSQPNNEGHAVLTIVTSRGDLIVDNLTNELRWWDETSYTFHKRVSQHHAGEWVNVHPIDFLARQ